MTRFHVLKRIEKEECLADLMVEFVKKYKTSKSIAEVLKKELTEEELQTIKSVAQSDYPLSFSGMQW